MSAGTGNEPPKSPLQEITQPFVDLIHAPRALWGINLAYVLEGMVYFGMLGYLTIYFSEYVFQGVEHADVYAHSMVMILTAGITISMFFLGFVPDKLGVRVALIAAFLLMIAGRVIWSGAPNIFGLKPNGLNSSLQWVTVAGMLLVVLGYGMYQPAAYAAVRQFTSPKTAGMGFAMLYALMNLGGWFPTFAFLLREERYLNFGIPGTFWVYTGFTVLALLATLILLTPKTVRNATAAAREETERLKAEAAAKEAAEKSSEEPSQAADAGTVENVERPHIPAHMWLFWLGMIAFCLFKPETPWYYTWNECCGAWAAHGFASSVVWRWLLAALAFVSPLVFALVPPAHHWLARHPLTNGKFAFFIFALIPVQTLFTYNWFILPPYISRAYEGWIGEKFEIASNANPILIFIAVPLIAAATGRRGCSTNSWSVIDATRAHGGCAGSDPVSSGPHRATRDRLRCALRLHMIQQRFHRR